jgi:hypothetical protein
MVSVCEADVYELFVEAAVLEGEFQMLMKSEPGRLWASVETVPLAGHLMGQLNSPVWYASYHIFLK